MAILYVEGIDDTDSVKIVANTFNTDRRRIGFGIRGNVELKSMLQMRDLKFHPIVVGGIQCPTFPLPPVDLIFNAICDPDTNCKTLATVHAMAQRFGVPVINPPERIMQTVRERTGSLLAGITGVRVPHTVRIAPTRRREVLDGVHEHGLRLPVLVRPAGSHNSEAMVVLGSADDIDLLDCFAFDESDYYITEFVDFASPDGLYRKFRFLVIGGEIVPRHLVVADQWKIKSGTRHLMDGNAALRDEEAEVLQNGVPEFVPALQTIAGRVGLDYFGVDCARHPDGGMLVFEINACFRPRLGPVPELYAYHTEVLERLESALHAMVRRRLNENVKAHG